MSYADIAAAAIDCTRSIVCTTVLIVVRYNGRCVLNQFHIRCFISEMPNYAIRHEVRLAGKMDSVNTAQFILFVRRELLTIDINRLRQRYSCTSGRITVGLIFRETIYVSNEVRTIALERIRSSLIAERDLSVIIRRRTIDRLECHGRSGSSSGNRH